MAHIACSTLDFWRGETLHKPNSTASSRRLRETSAAGERLPLFDTPRFVRDLESAYDVTWQRHVAGQPPQALSVSDQPDLG